MASQNGFLTYLSLLHNWPVKNTMHAQNGRLWQVDNRRAKQWAEDSTVADGEGTALHVLDRELVVSGALAQRRNLLLDIGVAHPFNVANDGHHQALWRRDGNTDVNVVSVNDVATVNDGIDSRIVLQRGSGWLEEGWHEAKFQIVLFQELLPVGFSQFH